MIASFSALSLWLIHDTVRFYKNFLSRNGGKMGEGRKNERIEP